MANRLKRTADALRTAPFGLSLLTIGIMTGPPAHLLIDGPELKDLYAFPLNGAGIAIGGLFMAIQFKLKHRLEDSIERNGYDERAMATTTDEWCNRQTARVVCGNSGNLDEYEALCEQRRATARFPRIPHV